MKRRSGPRSRTSIYLGVTQYKRTGRWEAHIWESSETKNSKGRQLHLGSFPAAQPAALAYDRAAYRLRPTSSHFNFPDTDYSQDEFVKKYGHLDKYEFVQRLRNWAQVRIEEVCLCSNRTQVKKCAQSTELADQCDTLNVTDAANLPREDLGSSQVAASEVKEVVAKPTEFPRDLTILVDDQNRDLNVNITSSSSNGGTGSSRISSTRRSRKPSRNSSVASSTSYSRYDLPSEEIEVVNTRMEEVDHSKRDVLVSPQSQSSIPQHLLELHALSMGKMAACTRSGSAGQSPQNHFLASPRLPPSQQLALNLSLELATSPSKLALGTVPGWISGCNSDTKDKMVKSSNTAGVGDRIEMNLVGQTSAEGNDKAHGSEAESH